MRRTKRNHAPVVNATVPITAAKGDKPLAGLAEQFDIHPN
ncbi:MAG: IS3 family transposase, partial [Candidatus Nitrotoga sp.]